MKPKNQEKAITEWEKMKKRGIVKHTLIFGGAFSFGFQILSIDWSKLYMFQDIAFTLKFIGKFLFMAIFMGLAIWVITKNQYKKAIKLTEKEKTDTKK